MTNDGAREYYKSKGLSYSNINEEKIMRLIDII